MQIKFRYGICMHKWMSLIAQLTARARCPEAATVLLFPFHPARGLPGRTCPKRQAALPPLRTRRPLHRLHGGSRHARESEGSPRGTFTFCRSKSVSDLSDRSAGATATQPELGLYARPADGNAAPRPAQCADVHLAGTTACGVVPDECRVCRIVCRAGQWVAKHCPAVALLLPCAGIRQRHSGISARKRMAN